MRWGEVRWGEVRDGAGEPDVNGGEVRARSEGAREAEGATGIRGEVAQGGTRWHEVVWGMEGGRCSMEGVRSGQILIEHVA